MKTRIPLTFENVRRYLPRFGEGTLVRLSDGRRFMAWESLEFTGRVYVRSLYGSRYLDPPCDGWAIEIERPSGCWKRRLKSC